MPEFVTGFVTNIRGAPVTWLRGVARRFVQMVGLWWDRRRNPPGCKGYEAYDQAQREKREKR